MSQRGPEKSPLWCQPAGRAEGWQGQKGEAPCRAGQGSLLSSPPSGSLSLQPRLEQAGQPDSGVGSQISGAGSLQLRWSLGCSLGAFSPALCCCLKV